MPGATPPLAPIRSARRVRLLVDGSLVLLAILVAACGTTNATPSASTSPAASGPAPTSTATATASSATASPTSTAAPEAQAFTAQGMARDVLFAPDGRIVVATGDFSANRSQVTMLGPDGSVLAGWPWSAGETGSPVATAGLGPDASVYVAVRHEVGGGYTWDLHRLDIEGREVAGFPVQLPPVATCALSIAGAGDAYAACEEQDDATGATTTTLSLVRPDGSAPGGWPVIVDGSATIAGFLPDGSVVAWVGASADSTLLAIRPDGSTAPGWPRPAPAASGSAVVDATGRVVVTSSTWAEDQCGPATGTTYTVLAGDGTPVAGWPVHLRGWASGPLVGADGSLTVVTDGGKALRYGADGAPAASWTAPKVSVTISCYGGSAPVAAGDGGVLVVGDVATLLAASGEIVPGWPVTLPFAPAIECPGCTPGPGAPLAPAVGADDLYVAAYAEDQPRLMTLGRDGSLVEGGQRVVGNAGDEIGWVRVAPTGRVWMLLTRWIDESATTILVPVAEDRAPGA